MINASTDRISPIVITAPTIVRSCEIPGSPLSFGGMLTSSGTNSGRFGATAVTRSINHDKLLTSRSPATGNLGLAGKQKACQSGVRGGPGREDLDVGAGLGAAQEDAL